MENQPGLEVSPHQSSASTYQASVSPDHTSRSPGYTGSDSGMFESGLEVVPEQPGLYPVPPKPEQPQPNEKIVALAQPAAVSRRRRGRVWWMLGGVVLVLVIIGAVVGGVVGSRASHNSNSSDDASSSASGTATSTGSAPAATNTMVLENSRIALTGYRIKDTSTFRFRLFFQDTDHHVRYSDYFSYNDSWTPTVTLENISVLPNTPLAASAYLENDPPDLQLYFLNDTSVLKCFYFRPETGQQGAQRFGLANLDLVVDRTAHLGAYHPFIAVQQTNNSVLWIRDSVKSWPNRTLDITGSEGTSMVVLSAAATYLKSASILYRTDDGYLTTYVADKDNINTLEEDWSWYYGQIHTEIPSSSAFSAFEYARGEDNFINTFVVYQDDDNVLQYVWQNDSSAWQGPATDDALGNADEGTDIACLTAQAWNNADVAITNQTDMNRCFFQRGKTLWQVQYDGENWQDLGAVPLT